MEATAGKVLQHYYELRRRQSGVRSPHFFRKRVWTHAENYLAWAAKAKVDPLRFLEYRFRVGEHGRYVPKLNQLRSYELAKLFREEWMQDELGADRAYAKLERRAGTKREQVVKALRLLTPAMEAVKYPYVLRGRHELCLAESGLSGGFHPESRYCPTCPVGVRCAAKLYQVHGFDVVALRAGRLHELPKDIAAAAIR
jgi:hypothetical protein